MERKYNNQGNFTRFINSEYDIEVSENNDDIALVKDASKLIIAPTYVGNAIEDIDIISNPQSFLN
jgi:hypothetical protein